ncbi:ABC transporter permease [Geminocystis sp. CENA526]|uniref:ABC transporter permease n=1 Tax=Geminocystis sp. CENA526 TaxID=1355871 RepID=UPI003D6E7EB5
MLHNIGEWNPQLFREIQGRLKPKTISIVTLASIIGQFLLFVYFKGMLTLKEGNYSRYCTGIVEGNSYNSYDMCNLDLWGNVQIIKELWWLDLFITMSIMGVFILLVVGCYMLIADVSKENAKNTLNFIRLTPQSAMTIFGGKILGVPILVYLFGILAVPLHSIAGLKANISFPLILAFYGLLAVACFFFYSASILFSLVSTGLGNFQAWLGSMVIFFFLSTTVGVIMNSPTFSNMSFDWLLLFNPVIFLPYVVKSTFLSPQTINYFSLNGLNNLSFYGNFWWKNAFFGSLFIITNYAIWTFWLWQGIKRRFHNPTDTVISKYHSYLISACFIVFNMGFTLQQINYDRQNESLIALQVFNFFFFLLLIPTITPHRQTLQDWARYSHENSVSSRNKMADLLLGEKSPSPLSIIVNVSIVTLYLIPSVLIFSYGEDKLSYTIGFLFSGMMIIIYGIIFQLFLTVKNQKRNLIASASISSLIFSPFLTLIILGAKGTEYNIIWLFSAFPLVGVDLTYPLSMLGVFLTQAMIIITSNYQLKRVLNKAGISETKALLNDRVSSLS